MPVADAVQAPSLGGGPVVLGAAEQHVDRAVAIPVPLTGDEQPDVAGSAAEKCLYVMRPRVLRSAQGDVGQDEIGAVARGEPHDIAARIG